MISVNQLAPESCTGDNSTLTTGRLGLPRNKLFFRLAFITIVITSVVINSRILTIYSSVSSDLHTILGESYLSTESKISCFQARNDSTALRLWSNLSTPFVNVGLPKVGSTSLHHFFRCGNINSSHYYCLNNVACAKCIKGAVNRGDPPLESCGGFDSFMQLDNGQFFPQIENLHEIHEENPNATFLLPFRNTSDWYRSLENWPPRRPNKLSGRLKITDITGFPSGIGENEEEFSEWFCSHVQNIRKFVSSHPSHALIEIDITSPHTSNQLVSLFGIRKSCWKQRNKNPNVVVEEEKSDDGDRDSKGFEEDCFKPKINYIPASLRQNLPKPYINLGLPKMGTTSIQNFFQCGNFTTSHFYCNKKACAKCITQSIEAGLPPMSECAGYDVYSQIDNAHDFPQITHLEKFMEGYSNATFFLTFRSMDAWYKSLTNWPPTSNKTGIKMDYRLRVSRIPGLPAGKGKNVKEFSEWFCWHVQRVRKTLAKYPQHTLVEVDIEDAKLGQQMEDIFGISKSCWGQTNVNTYIHPELNESEISPSLLIARSQRAEEQRKIHVEG